MRVRDLPPVRRRRPRLRVVPGRRRARGAAVVVDPALRDRAVPRRGRATRRAARSACSRRTRTPTISPATAGSRSTTAVTVHVHPAAEVEYPHRAAARTAASIELGAVVDPHDPHARPPAGALLPRRVRPQRAADEPWVVLTGDSLFVGDAARPDLAVEAREGAEGLFHSLRRLRRAARRRRGLPGPRRRLALRRRR